MTLNELRSAVRKIPFRPFTIRVVDGREYQVPHPDFVLIHPAGRTAVVATTDDDFYEIIDIIMISSLHYGNGRKRRRGRKAA